MRSRLPLLRDLPREVAVLTVVAFCVALGFGIVLPSIPIFARTFGVSNLAAAAVVSAFALVRFVSSPAAGSLVVRFGERATLAVGLGIVAVSSALAGLSQSYPQLLILRGLGGFGSAMFTVAAQALILRVTLPEQRGRASAAWSGGFLIGGVVGPAVGGIVVAWSIRAPFFVYAATVSAAAIVALVFLSASTLRQREAEVARVEAGGAVTTDTVTDGSETATVDPDHRGWPALREALRSRAYQAALTTNMMTGLVTFGLRAALIPIFVVEGLRSEASLAAIGFLLAAAAQAAVLIPAGRRTDRVGRRPSILIGISMTVIGMVLITMSDVLTNDPAASTTPGVTLFLLAMAVMGFGSAFLSAAPAAVVGDVLRGRKGGSVIAAYQMVSDFGSVIGPLLAGFLVDAFDFDWAFAVGAGIAALSLITAIRMPETLNRVPRPQA
jgi:MFS family permease